MAALIVSTGRSALLAILVAFSLIILVINANLLNLAAFRHDDDDDDDDDSYQRRIFDFETTSLAVAILTLLTVVPVLIMNYILRRSVASIVLFEIGWVSILMIFWAVTAWQTSGTSISDDGCSGDDNLVSFCSQFQVIRAFSWLSFIILLLWLTILIVVTARAHNRGHAGAWRYPLSDAIFLSKYSSPESYGYGKNTVLVAQNPDRERPMGQSGQGGSARVPTSSREPKEYQGTLPSRQGYSQMTPFPQKGQHPTTPTLPQV